MDKDQYYAFIDALVASDKTEFKQWEGTPYFDGCLPIEIMAERGPETLRHGPMKPMGLTNAHKPDEKAYAVVQLRQDNALGTLYNMVGFQTKMKYGAQTEILRTIPGLENAEFARLGGMHRNTYINSPDLLNETLTLKTRPGLRFAGQITGCEGYVESAAIGLLAARFAAAELAGKTLEPLPQTTAFGSLLYHITKGHIQWDDEPGKKSFQPMNINFGLFPPVEIVKPENFEGRFRGKDKARVKKQTVAARALHDCEAWLNGNTI
jgi:methylenetetrahydrofolate--tRNA-(uracil-5-)-methyltransferase